MQVNDSQAKQADQGCGSYCTADDKRVLLSTLTCVVFVIS